LKRSKGQRGRLAQFLTIFIPAELMDAPHPPSQANQPTDEVAPPEFVYADLAPALDAFSTKEDLSGDTLLDTNACPDENSSEESEDKSAAASNSGKLAPVAQLAQAMETGMTAIAAAMKDDHFQALSKAMEQQTRALKAQQQETRRVQELQLQLMQRLLDKTT
jgi:hypothetical protein